MHSFKYVLKTLFRKRMLIFWTYAFPIILGLLFNFAFSDIEKGEKLSVIDIAIVNDESFTTNEYYQTAFNYLSDKKSDDRLFNIKYVNEDKANDLLDEKEITGYIKFGEETKIVVKSNGYNESVMKVAVDKIIQNEKLITNVVEIKLTEKLSKNEIKKIEEITQEIYQDAMTLITDKQNENNTNDITKGKLGYTTVEFYTLIAMSCLYGGIIAACALNQNLANMSSNGKRIAVSPMSKTKVILTSVIASYIVQVIGVALLILFTVFVLNIDYGANLGLIILETLVGVLAGLSLGVFISSVFKTSEEAKTGIILAITMFYSFLSGMMGITTKYMIDKNIPILNKINPANMITDGFYSLYYYDTLNRYYFNIVSLLIFSVILIAISIYKLRGQKYDNI